MKTKPAFLTKQTPQSVIIITGVILIGLVLAACILISPRVAAIGLSVSIIITFTVLIRRIDYLIFAWFVLSWLMYWIASQFPETYESLIIRSTFWGLIFCINVSWFIDTILNRRKPTPFDYTAIKVIIFSFLIWLAIPIFITPNIFRGMVTMSRILIAFITSYVLYDFLSRDENSIKRLLTILSVLAISISFGTLVDACYKLVSGITTFKNVYAVLGNNALGCFLFISSPILITSGLYFNNNKRLKTFLVVILLLALFFSFSRASWLAALVSFSFLLWKNGWKVPLVISIVLVLLIGMILFVGTGEDFYGPYIQEGSYGLTGTATLSARWEGWKAAWDIIRNHPVLGAGGKIEILREHSIYLSTAVSKGLPSLLFIFAFYATFFYSSARIEKALKSQYLKSIVTGSMAALLGLMVYGVFEITGILTDYGAVGWNPLYPYVIAVLPFAAKKVEERQETGK